MTTQRAATAENTFTLNQSVECLRKEGGEQNAWNVSRKITSLKQASKQRSAKASHKEPCKGLSAAFEPHGPKYVVSLMKLSSSVLTGGAILPGHIKSINDITLCKHHVPTATGNGDR